MFGPNRPIEKSGKLFLEFLGVERFFWHSSIKVVVHVILEIEVPGVQRVDNIRLLSKLVVNKLEFVKLIGKIQVLHEQIDLFSLARKVD